MITGFVNATCEAHIRIAVINSSGNQEFIQVLVDTGFDGWLTLPSPALSNLGLNRKGQSTATLADGSEAVFDFYEATVVWDGKHRRILIDSADAKPLIGMSMLVGHSLSIEVRPGGRVTIERLS